MNYYLREAFKEQKAKKPWKSNPDLEQKWELILQKQGLSTEAPKEGFENAPKYTGQWEDASKRAENFVNGPEENWNYWYVKREGWVGVGKLLRLTPIPRPGRERVLRMLWDRDGVETSM